MLEYLDQAKSMYKNAKNSILKIPEMEAKVLEATSSEAWGASSTQMREIARATHSYANFPIIMDTLWRRIDDEPKNWRHILKGLILLDFLVKNGSEQCVREARVHLMQVQRLYDFTYVEGDKDYGLTIREKSRQLSDLINDDDRIAEEREKARVTASKFSEAISSDTYHPGHGGSYGGRGGGDYGRDSYDRGYDRGGRGEYDRGGRDYDRGRDRDYGRDDEYRRRDDYQDARSPQPAPRGHIRAPSGGGSAPAPAPAPAPAAAKPPVDFFDLMDEPKQAAPAQQPSTDFFDAFPESKAAAPAALAAAAPASAPANDFFSTTPAAAPTPTAPLAPTNQEPDEWADFAKVEAEDTKNPWSNKKLFDLDNLATPTATSASSGNKLGALGATTSPTRPLGATTTPLGAAAPLGAGRGFVPTATPLGAPLGAPLGVAPALGRGVPVAAPLGVAPAGYAVAAPGLAYPTAYAPAVAAAPYGAVPMAYPAAPVAYGVAPAGYAVASGVGVGLRPGVPVQPGFGPK